MTRLLVTLWFTATALIGPALCCCEVKAGPIAPATKSAGHPPAGGHDAPCCHRTPERQPPTPADAPAPTGPDECPCQGQPPTDRLAVGATAVELTAQSRGLDGMWLAFLPSAAGDRSGPLLSGTDASAGPNRPAGRELLSAYQILRC